MYKTNFAGLTVLEAGDPLQTDGSSFTARNPVITDYLLQLGARTHRHDGHAALEDPTDQPEVELAGIAGTLPSDTTVGIAYTLVDQDGGETLAAPVGSVTTPSPMEAPLDEPVIEIENAGGTMLAGTYYYVLTLTDGAGGETEAGPSIVVDIPPGSDFNRVLISGLGDIVAATPDALGWRLYKSTSSSQMHFLASGEAILDSVTDDGTLCLDCTETPPSENTTHQDNAITVTIPDTVLNNQDRCIAYRVYLGLDGDFTSPAFLEQRALDTLGIPKTYGSTLTDPGSPPDVSTSIPGATKIDPDTDILDWVWRRPVATYNDLPDGIQGDVRLTLDDGRLWVVLGADGAMAPSQWSQIKGASVAGTNEVQEITVTATGGDFNLLRGVAPTIDIAYNALAVTVKAALEALPTIGPGNVIVTGPAGGPYTVTYVGARAGTDQPELTADITGLTGPGAGVAIETLVEGGQVGHAIWDEGVALPARNVIDFMGEAVTVTDDPVTGRTIVTITATGGGGGGGGGYAGGEFSSSTDLAIPDGGAAVETAVLNVPDTAIIGTDTDFPELQLFIEHTYSGDLQVDLLHPDGTAYNVIFEEGPDANVGDSFAPGSRAVFTPLTEQAWPHDTLVAGRFRPMGDWSSMIGKDIEGDWKLRLRDQWAGDSGSLRDWGLVFTAGATELPGDQQLLLNDSIDWYEGSQYGARKGQLFLRPKSQPIFSGTDILNPFGFPGTDIVNELNAATLAYDTDHIEPTDLTEKRFVYRSNDDRWWMDDFRWVMRFDILTAGWGSVEFGVQDKDGNRIGARLSEAHTTMQVRRLIEEDEGVESNPATATFGSTPGVGIHWVAIERAGNRILFQEYRTDPATNAPYRSVEYVPATNDRHWDVGLSLGYRPWFRFIPADINAVTYFKTPDQLKPGWARFENGGGLEPWFRGHALDGEYDVASRLVPAPHPLLTNEREQIVWHADQPGGVGYIHVREGRAYLTGRVSVADWTKTNMLAKALPRRYWPLEDTYVAANYQIPMTMNSENRQTETWRVTTAGTIIRQQPPNGDGQTVLLEGISWLVHPNYL